MGFRAFLYAAHQTSLSCKIVVILSTCTRGGVGIGISIFPSKVSVSFELIMHCFSCVM